MGALPHYVPLVEHHDLVGALHGLQAMRDDQHGLAHRQPAQALLDLRLVVGVCVGGRLVEDDDGRVTQEHACHGDALALAPREGGASLAQNRLVALRKGLDDLVDAGGLRGFDHLLVRRPRSHEDVCLHRVVEEEGVLRHQGRARREVLAGHVAHVDAAEQDRAFLRVKESQGERRTGRLARAAGTHHPHHASLIYRKAHVVERRW